MKRIQDMSVAERSRLIVEFLEAFCGTEHEGLSLKIVEASDSDPIMWPFILYWKERCDQRDFIIKFAGFMLESLRINGCQIISGVKDHHDHFFATLDRLMSEHDIQTQAALARLIKMDAGQLSHLMSKRDNSKYVPEDKTLQRIADAFGELVEIFDPNRTS